MDILKIVLMIIFVIDCIALSAIILLQEGKSAGLGTISGAADSYWGQNKGRSMEGALVKSTKFLAILFLVLAAVLNLKVFPMKNIRRRPLRSFLPDFMKLHTNVLTPGINT